MRNDPTLLNESERIGGNHGSASNIWNQHIDEFCQFRLIAKLYVWPRLRTMNRYDSLIRLVAPHMFLHRTQLFSARGCFFAATSSLCSSHYRDFVAGFLAIIATIALSRRAAWAIVIVWLFNIWGAADLLFAFFQGARTQLDPGTLGAAFFIVSAIVPPLLVTHALISGFSPSSSVAQRSNFDEQGELFVNRERTAPVSKSSVNELLHNQRLMIGPC